MTRPPRRARLRRPAAAAAALLTVALLAGGCAGPIDGPPEASPQEIAPIVPDDPDTAGVARVTVPTLNQDTIRRRAAGFTMRVRNLTCEGVATGSGFALDATTLVTNRHVVAGAELLEVNTTDGRTLTVDAAAVGVLGDIAFITVRQPLPVTAEMVPSVAQGTAVSAVGFPLGGRFTITDGVVLDRVDGVPFGVPGEVLRISARVQPGNSGGPLINARGQVVGVVYAIETDTGFGLAIPIDTFQDLVADGGTEAVPACGEE